VEYQNLLETDFFAAEMEKMPTEMFLHISFFFRTFAVSKLYLL